jgi:hypothetical protein
MDRTVADRVAALDQATMTPVVQQILQDDEAEVLSWHVQSIVTGVTREDCLYRIQGQALCAAKVQDWSVVLKILIFPENDPTGFQYDPTGFNYWCREPLIYDSGLLSDLPGAVRAPRCYGVEQIQDGEWWCWIEDLGEETVADWSLDDYRRAARCLGEFNGAYLVDRPLPDVAWLSRGRMPNWVSQRVTISTFADIDPYLDHPFARTWLSRCDVEQVLQVWQRRDRYLAAHAQLPRTFCHHDAWPSNLRWRQDHHQRNVLVAFDWQMVGVGAVGDELSPLMAGGLIIRGFDWKQAHALDEAVFTEYVEGLCAAGWRGDPRLVRYGYTVNLALITVIFHTALFFSVFPQEEEYPFFERVCNQSMEELVSRMGALMPFFLDMAHEADQLLAALDL